MRSAASRRAAANRIARTADDAEAMNLHLCSLAPARAITVGQAAFDSIWDEFSYVWHNPWSGLDVRIVDLRQVLADASGAQRWSLATSPVVLAPPVPSAPPAGDPASSPVGEPTSEDPDVIFGSVPGVAAGVGSGGLPGAAMGRGLPVTGLGLGLAKVGAGAFAVGLSLLALTRRRLSMTVTDDDRARPRT